MSTFNFLNIIPGNKCELACSHCANSSGPKFNNVLSPEEIGLIVNMLNSTMIPKIILTGGEPTLYLDVINQIFDKLEYEPFVSITTNGIFVQKGNIALLNSMKFLDHIQLSYDPFHGNMSDGIILELKRYANANNKTFNISYCVQSPLDLINVEKIKKTYNVEVVFERVTKSGRATKTDVYYKFPDFDESVLDKKCPNTDVLTFIQGKGFTHCCSNLNFNHDDHTFFDKSVENYFESNFFKLSSEKTFREIIALNNIKLDNLSNEDSLECNICEKIFCSSKL